MVQNPWLVRTLTWLVFYINIRYIILFFFIFLVPAPVQSTIPPRPRRRRRSSIPRASDINMEQLVSIEARRVDAELTTAQVFSQMSANMTQLSENIGNIASALNNIANAISDVAKKMPNH